MRKYLAATFLLLSACSSTVLVDVPPRMDLRRYPALGIIEFTSNSSPQVNVPATRQFQEQVQAAQPGTRFIELGTRESLLAALGQRQLDAEALRKTGEKYGVAAVFVGEIIYSEPKADIRVNDLMKLDGAVRAEIRGDISSRLLETKSGASVWSSSAWVKKQLGGVAMSADRGVSVGVKSSDARSEMVPALVYQLTRDFRSTTVRQQAN
jgi:hypothetical protein